MYWAFSCDVRVTSHVKSPVHHFGVQLRMKYYCVVCCYTLGRSKCSGCDKDMSFYRIPKIIVHRSKQEYELVKKQRDGFLVGISREALRDSQVLKNDRICC